MGGERPAPDTEQVAHGEAATDDLDDPGRRLRPRRVRAAADPGGYDDRPPVREELEVDREAGRCTSRRRRLACRPRAGMQARDRIGVGSGVGGAGGEREGCGERDHRRTGRTSSKSGRKLSAAAAAPHTIASPQTRRAEVAGSAEITTPCQNTGSEPMLAAAAIPPTTPAAWTRRPSCSMTSTAARTTPTTAPGRDLQPCDPAVRCIPRRERGHRDECAEPGWRSRDQRPRDTPASRAERPPRRRRRPRRRAPLRATARPTGSAPARTCPRSPPAARRP